jgi:hypothetical protein|tara:strand:- start:21525 stop:22202 length:678 start_codon:yes stop_codon:yes gene_type:complete
MKFLLTAWLAIATSLAAAPLKFDKTLIEVHAPIDSETVTEDFKFTNIGDTAVVIREADAGCSCISVLVSGGKLAYAPGESGTLRANFSLGSFQGAVDKQINIWLEGDPDEKPSNTVTMRVHIPQVIKITPRTIKWKMGSDPVMQIVEIEMDHEKAIHVTSVSSSNSNFEVKLVTIVNGKKYHVEVTPKITDSPGLSVLRIETNLDIKKHRIQQSFAAISRNIEKK